MQYDLSKTSCPPRGPNNAKLLILGEAPGAEEVKARQPFVGASGRELEHWLNVTDTRLDQCYLTNVVKERPNGNDIENFCVSKKEADEEASAQNLSKYPYSALRAGKYLKPSIAVPALAMLRQELQAVKPNLVLALGNTALWALTQTTGISKYRGAVSTENLSGLNIKVLPTYHPSAVLRQFDLRGIAVADVIKAVRESSTPDITQKNRTIFVPETISELRQLVAEKLTGPLLCFDIETKPTQITCIGYACNDTEAVVIPLHDPRKPDKSYWTLPDEVIVWNIVATLQARSVKKLTQNGLYDTQYLWRVMGIPTYGEVEDTMMLHHSLYPEMDKGLGFLGSLYTNQTAWKQMRPRGTKMEGKSDE